ncbi:hypothetical protein AB3A94_000833 [Vibrio alginolyticus]|nr:hypothetical protein [Vibrio alginolyticus]ELB2840160.1 hypothetical protein [Vibrio alginolyticus]
MPTVHEKINVVELKGNGFIIIFDAAQVTKPNSDRKPEIALDKDNKELIITNLPDNLIADIERINAQPEPMSLFDVLILAAAIRR